VKRFVMMCSAMMMLLLLGSPAPGQTTATARLMREKLTHAQAILEALTTTNYDLLKSHSMELSRLTQAQGWEVLKGPEYRRYSERFVLATEGLIKAADDRDMDAAMNDYVSLTISCYQCHRYLHRARIARR
jgi:cytochrome c556